MQGRSDYSEGMRILVTGGRGAIGTALVAELRAQRSRIRPPARGEDGGFQPRDRCPRTVALAPEWRTENRDAPFTFRRLLARERNYQLQARRLRALDVPGSDRWLVLDESRLQDRALRVLAKPAMVSLLDRMDTLADPWKLGVLLDPLYRAAVSGYVRSAPT